MTKSQIFLFVCLSFIGGIAAASLFFIPWFGLAIILILCVFLISNSFVFKTEREKLLVIAVCLILFVVGAWRYHLAENQISKSKLRTFNDKKETVTIIGAISEEPEIGEGSIRLTLRSEHLSEDGKIALFSEKILVRTSRYPEYRYGDRLRVRGKLKTPPNLEGFNYQGYLAKEGIYSLMEWPDIELVASSSGNPAIGALFSFKNKFKETARSFIPPPQIGILEALVFGDESEISQEWKEKLNLTGTRHITAVSGMNITIIAFIIMSFMLALGLWRSQAFYLSVFLLLLYILMIGSPASAVRAGVMAGLLLAAQYFGRLSSAYRAVIFAASLMLLNNPLLLELDVGFQLSFLATLGIIYLQPIFYDYLKTLPNPKLFPIRTTISATFGAQVFTLPILIYNFGRVSLISPIANLLIVPLLAPVTIFIFIFGLVGMILYPLAALFAWPTWLFLSYLITLIDIFSKIPFALITLEISWVWLAISYLVLGWVIFWLSQKRRFKIIRP